MEEWISHSIISYVEVPDFMKGMKGMETKPLVVHSSNRIELWMEKEALFETVSKIRKILEEDNLYLKIYLEGMESNDEIKKIQCASIIFGFLNYCGFIKFGEKRVNYKMLIGHFCKGETHRFVFLSNDVSHLAQKSSYVIIAEDENFKSLTHNANEVCLDCRGNITAFTCKNIDGVVPKLKNNQGLFSVWEWKNPNPCPSLVNMKFEGHTPEQVDELVLQYKEYAKKCGIQTLTMERFFVCDEYGCGKKIDPEDGFEPRIFVCNKCDKTYNFCMQHQMENPNSTECPKGFGCSINVDKRIVFDDFL